jgi:hypothetical protein
VASRRIFWVAAVAGLIVFGTLMGAMFIGEQFLQNVLGYSTLRAGASVVPAALFMLLAAPLSAKLIERVGSRATLLIGYAFLFLSFLVMLLLWTATSGYAPVALAFILMGIGVGLSGTPASHSLTGSVPVHRAGMASGTADLQRDLGGSIMQSILGAILTAGYATAVASRISASGANLDTQVTNTLERSFPAPTGPTPPVPSRSSSEQWSSPRFSPRTDTRSSSSLGTATRTSTRLPEASRRVPLRTSRDPGVGAASLRWQQPRMPCTAAPEVKGRPAGDPAG